MNSFIDQKSPSMPKKVRPKKAPPHSALGVISSAVFLLALASVPFVGAALTWRMADAGAFSFSPSQASLNATRRALEAAASELTDQSADRLSAWNDMVARELAEGDESAARGLMLGAGAIAGQDAAAVAEARAQRGDAAALLAARPLLDEATALQAAQAGLFAPPEAAPMAAAGDARDLAVQSRAWLDGRGAALSELVLTGVSVSAPELSTLFGLSPVALQSGVVTLKAALRSGRLSPQFVAGVQATLQSVNTDGRLEQSLRAGMGADAALADEPGAARAAFVSSLADTSEWRAVTELLMAVDALTARLSWTGAVVILAQADTLEALPRLQLLADAGGETAAALAKRMDNPDAFLNLSRADFVMSPAIQLLIALLAACLATLLAAPGITLTHAVLQIWSAEHARKPSGQVFGRAAPKNTPPQTERMAA
jgi:predicted transglutaminase-like cysteine proteinase